MQVRIHSPDSQERIKGYSTGNSFISRRYLHHAVTCGVVTVVSYRVEGNRIYCLSIVCNRFVRHHSSILALWVMFSNRPLDFLVAIFSPWLLVTSVITWHVLACKHPTPCLSMCKWDNCYCCCCTKALVQMFVHGHIKMIWKTKPKHNKN